MAGTFFDYQPGTIKARFSHDVEFDYISLDLTVGRDTTITTACDDQCRLDQPIRHQGDDLTVSVYVSSVFCPFNDFIRFLEAITIEVQECAFEWDPEGPSGRMHWQRRYINDTGFLTISWDSSKRKFSHRVMFYTRQVVGELYRAFRAFVDGPDYDPLRYERLTNGEAFSLVIDNGTLDDLSSRLITFDSPRANRVVNRLREACGESKISGPRWKYPLEYFEYEPVGNAFVE